MANYLRDAIRYQQEMEEANRPVTVNSLMARKAAAIKQNAPAENMLTQYAQTMPQNWQQFGQNLAQAYPTPATGASRDQILGAVTQAAVNAGPLMTVYHGSPHKFDKFDASKIGTGEGAQAYGHGLYLAENPGVAKEYAKNLSENRLFDSKGAPFDVQANLSNPNVRAVLHKTNGDIDAAIARANQAIEAIPGTQGAEYAARDIQTLNALKSAGGLQKQGGSLYKVDLPDEHIAKMLDWDKPLSQQSAGVQALIQKAHEIRRSQTGWRDPLNMNLTGKDFLPTMGEDRLKEAGITGIRYLDQGSRAGGQGTSNFVVFPGNEGLLKILERQ